MELFTVKQAARRLSVSASKVYQLVELRLISHFRVGGKILFSEPDLAAYLESCRVGISSNKQPIQLARPRLRNLTLE
jgi:excisionase family DNA binding protein